MQYPILEEPQPLKHLCAPHAGAHVGGRSGKQCRERWYNHLSPAVTKAEWSVEEDDAIHRKVLELGTRHRMHTGVAPLTPPHSLLSRSVSLLSRAQGIRARLLTYIAALRPPERRAP